MRGLILLLQIVSPVLSLPLIFGFAMGLSHGSAGIAAGVLAIIVFGAVIGFFVWLPGLIVDRASLSRLALTVALTILGFTGMGSCTAVFYPRSQSPMIFFVFYAVPIAGAMAGCYWPWRKPAGGAA
jgi:hypothetical protein